MTPGADLTLLVAITAGLISFLSPCVLPLVPAYLGQLTAIAVVAGSTGRPPSRWLALSHAAAYVAGFGAVFTLLGVTATFAAAGFADALPMLRQVGGVILVVLGLSLAGLIRLAPLERTWRPLDAGAAASLARTTGGMALAPAGAGAGAGTGIRTPSRGDRLGGWLVGSRGGWLASFGLGAIFAVGWTPCIGVVLAAILALASDSGTAFQGGILLLGFTAGLGIPFLVVGALYDRAPTLLRPLVRHGRAVSVIGGLLVVAIGVAMIMDWLALLPRFFQFSSFV